MRRTKILSTALAALSAFAVYTCMYAFRKPFTVAGYEGMGFWGVDYKVWLVIAQTIGYTASKFYGIRFIAELRPHERKKAIILFIGCGWLALLLFALVPAPFHLICLLLNGFFLGVIYGLVFSYLEGRRSTELLGAVLATSFIFASGFTQSAGKYLLTRWNVDVWWMPFLTGALFLLPTIFFTFLLDRTPPPDVKDQNARTRRMPMSRGARKEFIRRFRPGLVMLILCYILLTVLRDYRSNFASDIWKEIGAGADASVFTRTELPASLITLVLMGSLVFVRKNIRALLLNHWIIIAGFCICISSTLLYQAGMLSPFWWMSFTGVGLYMGYVPFNALLFERLLASFHHVGTAGFIIYVADAFGYLGSDAVLLTKSFLRLSVSWSGFFEDMLLLFSMAGIALTLAAALYWREKYKIQYDYSVTTHYA